jgi:hypothetical protein
MAQVECATAHLDADPSGTNSRANIRRRRSLVLKGFPSSTALWLTRQPCSGMHLLSPEKMPPVKLPPRVPAPAHYCYGCFGCQIAHLRCSRVLEQILWVALMFADQEIRAPTQAPAPLATSLFPFVLRAQYVTCNGRGAPVAHPDSRSHLLMCMQSCE